MQATYFQISHIANALRHTRDNESVAIRPSGDGIRVVTVDDSLCGRIQRLFERVLYFVGSFFGYEGKVLEEVAWTDARDTTAFFKEVFGEKRFAHISNAVGVDMDKRDSLNLPFLRKDIEKLFVGAAEIRMEDLEDLFFEFQDESFETVRFLSAEETADIRQAIGEAETVRDLPKRVVDSLVMVLIPFASKEDLFLHRLPCIDPYNTPALTDFDLRRQRVAAMEQLRRGQFSEEEWAVYLSKRIVGYRMEPNVLLAHPRGYFENFAVISAKGACKYLLRFCGADPEVRNCVLYRGTCCSLLDAASDVAECLTEDLREEMGSMGPVRTYEETKAFLFDPEKGFVRSPDERVDGVGFSLGGVHLQRDALLFSSKITHITTVCAPGIDRVTARLYADRVHGQRSRVRIVHYTEVDDLTDELGEAKIGLGISPDRADIEAIAVSPIESQALYERDLVEIGADRPRIWPFTRSLDVQKVLLSLLENTYSHLRTTSMVPFVRYSLSNQDPVEAPFLHNFLEHAAPIKEPIWERIRRCIAITSDDEPSKPFLEFVMQLRSSEGTVC